MHEFKMPSLGSDMEEGKILHWLVKPGDHVKKGDVVVEVDTEKAAIEVQIWEDGVVDQLAIDEGETVPVGTPILILKEDLKEGRAVKAPKVSTPAAPAAPAEAQASAAAAMPAPIWGKKISPAARRRAQELAIGLEHLQGSGPDGAVTVTDVEMAAERGRKPSPTPTPTPTPAPTLTKEETARIRSEEMRRAIAMAMSRSNREIPHYYLSTTVPLLKATRFLQTVNQNRPITERILMPALFFRAITKALTRFSEFNGYWVDDHFEKSDSINLGIAVSLRAGGLLTPAILSAEKLSLEQMMKTMVDLVTRTRSGGLKSSEYTGATITVTNLGERSAEEVYGVIFPPQVALIGIGSVVDRPWVQDGRLTVMPSAVFTLAADHRASDGHRGGLLVAAITNLLQEPDKL